MSAGVQPELPRSAGVPGLKVSRYSHLVPHDDARSEETLLFNAATGALVELDADGLAEFHALLGEHAPTGSASAASAASAASESAKAFVAGGFVVPAGMDEVEEVRRRYRAWQRDRSTLSLTVAPTL